MSRICEQKDGLFRPALVRERSAWTGDDLENSLLIHLRLRQVWQNSGVSMKRLLTFSIPFTILCAGAAGAGCVPQPHWAGVVRAEEAKYGMPTNLLWNLLRKESQFCAAARSPRGAIGLGQLMPGTARLLKVNPWDPVQNIRGSAAYLAQQYKTFRSWPLALAAYNAGPGNVMKYRGIPPFRETRGYVATIMRQTGTVVATASTRAAPVVNVPATRSTPAVPAASTMAGAAWQGAGAAPSNTTAARPELPALSRPPAVPAVPHSVQNTVQPAPANPADEIADTDMP